MCYTIVAHDKIGIYKIQIGPFKFYQVCGVVQLCVTLWVFSQSWVVMPCFHLSYWNHFCSKYSTLKHVGVFDYFLRPLHKTRISDKNHYYDIIFARNYLWLSTFSPTNAPIKPWCSSHGKLIVAWSQFPHFITILFFWYCDMNYIYLCCILLCLYIITTVLFVHLFNSVA